MYAMAVTPIWDWMAFFRTLAVIVGVLLVFAAAFVAYCCCAMSSRCSRMEEGRDGQE